MPQGVNAIALAEKLVRLFRYHGGSRTMGIHKFHKHANQLLPRKPYIYICYIFGNVSFQVYPNRAWRIIRFQTDDAHMRIYAVADQDKYLINIYQKLTNERDIFFKLVNCSL